MANFGSRDPFRDLFWARCFFININDLPIASQTQLVLYAHDILLQGETLLKNYKLRLSDFEGVGWGLTANSLVLNIEKTT